MSDQTVKADAGKLRPTLVFPSLIRAVMIKGGMKSYISDNSGWFDGNNTQDGVNETEEGEENKNAAD